MYTCMSSKQAFNSRPDSGNPTCSCAPLEIQGRQSVHSFFQTLFTDNAHPSLRGTITFGTCPAHSFACHALLTAWIAFIAMRFSARQRHLEPFFIELLISRQNTRDQRSSSINGGPVNECEFICTHEHAHVAHFTNLRCPLLVIEPSRVPYMFARKEQFC